MYLSTTLSAYIVRQFGLWFGAIFCAMAAIVFLFDIVELTRRAAAKPEATLGVVLQLAALKLPHMVQEMFAFAVLFGAMFTFWRLTRSHELTVMRSCGVSVWQFLLPILGIAALLGLLNVAIVDPIAAAMLSRYEQIEGKYLRGRASLLAVPASGLWLRYAEAGGNTLVHARQVSPQDMELRDAIMFFFAGADRFTSRIDAARIRLEDGQWRVWDAWMSTPDHVSTFTAEQTIPTDLTVQKIQESFASPETISFWELPRFIEMLEAAGFSALRHRLHWHSELAGPLLLAAMVLIAATFSLRLTRRGGTAVLFASGLGAGFLLYVLSDVVIALGMSSSIPVVLAAWTPAGVSTLLGVTMLLHLEDG